ncbi:MAG: efflux RND transporter periplasmic adaptor subunit [Planctomycetota bacterium]|jgi:biotin carboxyl carrier protein
MTDDSDLPADGSVHKRAFQSLAAFNKIILEAGLCGNLQELIFLILNRTIECSFYDRAYLFSGKREGFKCLGVSGTAQSDAQSVPVTERRQLLKSIKEITEPVEFSDEIFEGRSSESFTTISEENGGNKISCFPVKVLGEIKAVLWLERWGGREWQGGEINLIKSLVIGYGSAWRIFNAKSSAENSVLNLKSRAKWLAAITILIILLICIKVPLRIVAPCEVVPDKPSAVTAPIEGIIKTINVEPGDVVKEKAMLFEYEKQVPLDELKAVKQRISVVKAQLEQAMAEALHEKSKRAEVKIFKYRLAEEEAKLSIAEYKTERLEVHAPVSGVVLLDDPNEWRGRPVTVGERVMMLVNPLESKVRIWLPQDDKISIDKGRPVRVILNTVTSDSVIASLTYMSNHAEVVPGGGAAFAAEAEWQATPKSHWMGLKGSAVIYGSEVPLYQWLFRKPLNNLRRYIGW